MDLLVKYLKGWINHDNMNNSGYWKHWEKVALEAKNENCDLVIFKIPKVNEFKSDSETVNDIEKLLQDKLGK
jgi:hypothetical protein